MKRQIFLTTERSEVVPFFRAVRAEGRVAKRPPPLVGERSEAPQSEGAAPSPVRGAALYP